MTTVALSRRTIQPGRRLRPLLTVNGAANVAGGAALAPLASTLDAPTGLPAGLLVGIGVFYLAYGAAMWYVATRPRPRAVTILALIAVNALWALCCLFTLTTDLAHPTTLGSLLLAAEAATVTGLAALQLAAYRRGGTPDRPHASEPLPGSAPGAHRM
ncbi:MAG: hypothetical protein J2P19_02790 [Pseudonocardia sp.]|nr:hypothetical protein [Pseudonocardia sp.]